LALGITKISIALLSISLIASFGLTSNQAFAGKSFTCQDCEDDFQFCLAAQILTPQQCRDQRDNCEITNELVCRAVGGIFEGVDTTALLVSGTQMNASWMIPVIVSAIGIGIVIARKF